MYAFSYQRASDAKAAVAALQADSDAKYLAGGQSLLPTMRLRLAQPSQLIDVTRIAALKEIKVDAKTVTGGAAARPPEAPKPAATPPAFPHPPGPPPPIPRPSRAR